jgi:hypothetical protein
MVDRPEKYRWSSYRATAKLEAPPKWLDTPAAKQKPITYPKGSYV